MNFLYQNLVSELFNSHLCHLSTRSLLQNTAKTYVIFQGDPMINSVFIIFFQGDQLKTRVKKICEGYAYLVC